MLPVFFFRRLVYAFILVFLTNFPFLQLCLCIITTIGVILYTAILQPYKTPLSNFLPIFEETLNALAFSICFKFLLNKDASGEEWFLKNGQYMIAIACSTLGLRLGIVLINSLISAKKVLFKVIENLRLLKKKLSNFKIARKADGNHHKTIAQDNTRL